ncbi:MAG: TonB-dependent receptor [Methyloversatilis discipulorum]|uniref:TonB-dependent receptor plug domain-containing protein n=1 Tax=Methyloversatilis discipulorum TaxID=1119528 RepID=UPI0026F1A33E|nr:TonB-dependent receptor [Methyloversatilis discipulorum]MBT9516037.1 TonB-dependent receptor [Methyloversatilis discipulorum]
MIVLHRFKLARTSALVAGALASLSSGIQAQDATADATSAGPLDAVVVTGTRRSNTTSLQASAPVDVISGKDLEATGAADLSRALISLSPSATFPSTPNGSFASSIPSGASLRGLSADQVLVLVNGKRRHVGANFTRQALAGGRGSAAVDLSLIPVAAIERVEILRDGAAAQYGSDAIAGVINIVLKGRDNGGAIGYRYGEYGNGYGGEQHTLSGWKGISLANDGFLTLSFDAGVRDFANNTNPDVRLADDHPYKDWKFGAPKVKDQFNLLANAEVPVNADLSLYAFATLSRRESVGEGFYESNTANSTLVRSAAFQQRYPFGRIPITVYELEDAALNVGARFGDKDLGRFDLYANLGQNTVKSIDRNGLNPSYGIDSPSTYDTGERRNTQANLGLDYVRDLTVDAFAGPLTLSAGLAYRWEEYDLSAGDPIAYTRGPFYQVGAPGVAVPEIYSGITDQDARTISRNVVGGYVGFESNVTEKLNLGLALRSEHYSDFGGTTTGKGSLRYDFTPEFAVRTTASTGYRAPSIVQLGYSAFSVQTANIGGVFTDVQQRTLLPGSPIAELLGGKALKPEESENVSLGFVWRPVSNASLTFDAYQIDIKNRVLLSENLSTTTIPALAPILAPFGINNAAFFTNVLDTRTRGFELSGKYRLELQSRGRLDLSAGFAATDTEITKARDVVTPNGTVIPSARIVGRATRGLVEDITPNNKLTLGAVWRIAQWEISSAARRYGKWTSRATLPVDDQTFDVQWVFDLDVAYHFSGPLKGLKASVGAINLFDSYPDKTRRLLNSSGALASVGGVTKYSFNAPEGGLGAFYYTSLNYSF